MATTAALLARTFSVQHEKKEVVCGSPTVAFKADRETRECWVTERGGGRRDKETRRETRQGTRDETSRATRKSPASSSHPFWPNNYCCFCCSRSLSLPLSLPRSVGVSQDERHLASFMKVASYPDPHPALTLPAPTACAASAAAAAPFAPFCPTPFECAWAKMTLSITLERLSWP